MKQGFLALCAVGAFLGSLLAAGGCGDDDPAVLDGNDDGSVDERVIDAGDGDAGDAGDDGGAPTMPELDEQSWTKIAPGGETICARGDDFHFFVRGGTVNKLVILFDGGGACWDAVTCSVADQIFSPTADEELPEPGDGIADKADEENPFRDWYQVFIPYCTGDIHWGDSDTTYQPEGDAEEITIFHRGRKNTQAVLDWVYEEFSAPESIFVTGVSAGAYGSIGWAPYIIEHYPNSRVTQLGDCGAGVITDTFFEDSFPSWKADSLIPDWIPGLDVPLTELKLENLYIELANHYPEQVFSQYNTHNDENQRFYYTAMGGKDEDWSPKMYEKIETIIDEAPTFRSYIAGGIKHVILPYPEFYTYESDGVRLRDWVKDLAEGEAVENVQCVDCDEPDLYEP
jgi:hypothetical protein